MAARFTLLKQSSLAPDDDRATEEEEDQVDIDPRVNLMYLANEGDLDGIKELLNSGIDVNFRDIDNRTALHISACQGKSEVVELLLSRGASVDSKDRWGSTVALLNPRFFIFSYVVPFRLVYFKCNCAICANRIVIVA